MKKNNTIRQILVSGSIAYDRIMDFPGVFSAHILPDQIHQINLSFAIPDLVEKFGGTAGNIAYNLSLLNLKPLILAQVGNDFEYYKKWLVKNKISTQGISVIKRKKTASAYIITDKDDNQITGFFLGAMIEKYDKKIKLNKNALAIIAPDSIDKMIYHGRQYKNNNIEYIFDPGQQISTLNKKNLLYLLKGSRIYISNDYELQLMLKKTGLTLTALKKMVPVVIITLGAKGSEIFYENKKIQIKPVKVNKIADPTGAGDAYRAGIIYGLIKNLDWKQTGYIASAIASKAVSFYGTQEHHFTIKSLNTLLYKNFKFRI